MADACQSVKWLDRGHDGVEDQNRATPGSSSVVSPGSARGLREARDGGYYPEELPEDDGADVLDFLDVDRPDWFADFCGAADRERRWRTLSGASVV